MQKLKHANCCSLVIRSTRNVTVTPLIVRFEDRKRPKKIYVAISVRGQSLWNVKDSFKCNKGYITRKWGCPGDVQKFLLIWRNVKFMSRKLKVVLGNVAALVRTPGVWGGGLGKAARRGEQRAPDWETEEEEEERDDWHYEVREGGACVSVCVCSVRVSVVCVCVCVCTCTYIFVRTILE